MATLLAPTLCPISYNTSDYAADIAAAKASIEKHKLFAFDIETVEREGYTSEQATNPRFADVEWVSVATVDGEWDWPIRPGTNPIQFLEKYFFSPLYTVIAHNAAFEFKFIIAWYWRKKKIWKVPKCNYVCTQRASWMANENRKRHGLKELTEDLLERDVYRYEEALVAKNSLWDFWKWRKYSRDDSRNALDLWLQKFKPAIEADAKHAKIFYEVELPNIIPVAEQEVLGIRGNEALVDKYHKERTAELRIVEKEIYRKTGRTFNIDSPKQLAQVLFSTLGIPKKGIPRGKDGTPSTSDLVLRDLADAGHQICSSLMRHRKISKELSGFWKQLKSNVRTGKGFFYPSARTTNQFTGRWDFKNPTLSTLPNPGKTKSRAREIIRARKGYKLVGGDWSQAELRIMAHLSQDPSLIKAYKEGLDLHEMTSKRVGCTRDLAKCLDASTLVITRDGQLQRIGDILSDLKPGKHRKIEPIWLSDGRGGWVKTDQGLVRENRPSVHVVTSRGIVTCTSDHRWLTTRGLVEAKDLREGDVFPEAVLPKLEGNSVSVRVNPFLKRIGSGPCKMTLGEGWAYFAGMFHGDGTMANGHTCTITHGSDKNYAHWRGQVRRAIKRVGLPASLNGAKTKTMIGSRVVANFLQQLGLGSKRGKNLSIPKWVLGGGRSIAWAYLAGMFDTDGTASEIPGNSVSLCTKSATFAGQISLLLRFLGCDVSVYPDWNKTYEKFYYRVRVRASSLDQFFTECVPHMRHKEKIRRITVAVKTRRLKARKTETVVKKVLDAGIRTVYDFHVENKDHLYLQGGFIGHNNLNFGLLYGMGPNGLQRALRKAGIKLSIEQCKKYVRRFFKAYPGIKDYHRRMAAHVIQNGYVRNPLGRLRRLKDDFLFNPGKAFRKAANSPVQSFVADWMKLAYRNIRRRAVKEGIWGPTKFHLLFTVHDELVGECPEKMAVYCRQMMQEEMEGVVKIRVPIKADVKIADTWYGFKEKKAA